MIDLEEAPIEFTANGTVYKLDLVEAEAALEAEPLKIDAQPRDPQRYIPLFQKWVEGKCGAALTFGQAAKLIDSIRYAYLDFKKKYNEDLKLVFPSASIHLNLLSERSTSSMTSLKESEQ